MNHRYRQQARLIPLLIWLAAICASGYGLLSEGKISTDLTAFMPVPSNIEEELLLDQLREGPAARIILMAVQGGERQTRADASKALAKRLRGSNLFVRVENGASAGLLDQQQVLFKYRYLLAPTPPTLDSATLREALELRLRELNTPLSSLMKDRLPADPTAAYRLMLNAWRPAQAPRRVDGVWVSASEDHALLFAETPGSGYDLDTQERLLESIDQAFDAVRGDADLRLLRSGSPVFAVDTRDTIRNEARRLTITASVFLVGVLVLVYRSFRLLVLSALPLVTAILVAAAGVVLMFGELHGITLAFGVTLLGVAVDYPLHLFSHAHAGEPITDSVKRIWPTLRLGVITTAIGYIAMSLTDFGGIAQLGIFAAIGLLVAAACSRWVLPGFFPHGWAPTYDMAEAQWFDRLPRFRRVLAWVAGAGGLAGILVISTAGEDLWEHELAALSPVPAAARDQDRRLRRWLGAPDVRHVVLITAPDAEQALIQSEALTPMLANLAQQDVLSGFEMAAGYLPSRQTQSARQQALPSMQSLQAAMAQATAGLPFKLGIFDPFLDAVEASRRLPPLTPAAIAATPLGPRVQALLYQTDRSWVAVVQLSGVDDVPGLASAFQKHANDNVHYVDLKTVSNQAVIQFRDQAIQRLAWSVPIVLVVLLAGVKRPRRVLAITLPLVLAIFLDLGLWVWMGERLSLFHIIALLLVVGIGIDYGLFFSLFDADSPMHRRTCHALCVCAVSTVSVFAILATSEIPLLQTMGKTVSVGVLATFVMTMAWSRVGKRSN